MNYTELKTNIEDICDDYDVDSIEDLTVARLREAFEKIEDYLPEEDDEES